MLFMSDVSPTDWALYQHIKTAMTQKMGMRRTNYIKQTELLWVGKHYLLIRTGPEKDGDKTIRKVKLWSREWLLLDRGNRENNDMMTLALAAIDPVHYDWTFNRVRLLHSTDVASGHVWFRGRKLTKNVMAEIIEFCKKEDSTFADREALESGKYADANTFAKGIATRVMSAGFDLCGTLERNGIQYPADNVYKTDIGPMSGGRKKFEFNPTSNREIDVDMRDLTLAPADFEILILALGKINENIKRRMPFYGVTPEEEKEDE